MFFCSHVAPLVFFVVFLCCVFCFSLNTDFFLANCVWNMLFATLFGGKKHRPFLPDRLPTGVGYVHSVTNEDAVFVLLVGARYYLPVVERQADHLFPP